LLVSFIGHSEASPQKNYSLEVVLVTTSLGFTDTVVTVVILAAIVSVWMMVSKGNQNYWVLLPYYSVSSLWAVLTLVYEQGSGFHSDLDHVSIELF